MSSKSIASLALLITANAAQLAGEFNRVDNVISRSTMKWQRVLSGGLKMGIGISGAQAALSVISAEIRRVIDNIEDIPGIPSEVVTSITEARGEFQEFRNTIDGGIAKMLHFGRLAAQSVGAGAAMWFGGASKDDIYRNLSKLPSPDELARAKDSGFDGKVRAVVVRIQELEAREKKARLTDAARVADLQAEAVRLRTYADSPSITTVAKGEAREKALQKDSEANDIIRKAQDASNKALDAWRQAREQSLVKALPDSEAIEKLRGEISGLEKDVANANTAMMLSGGKDIEVLQKRTELYEKLREKQQQIDPILERQRAKWEALGASIASSFEDAVFQGEGLKGMLKSLEQQLLKMAFNALVTKPLEAWLGKLFSGGAGAGGGIGAIFGGIGKILGFAGGGDPPVGRPSIVGERGPELFVPKVAGTIVPNSSLRDLSSRRLTDDRPINNYTFNLPGGVTDATFQQFARAVQAALGPGVIETRAIAGVRDAMNRGRF